MGFAITVKVVYLKSCPFCQLSQFWLAMQSCSAAGRVAAPKILGNERHKLPPSWGLTGAPIQPPIGRRTAASGAH